MNIRKCISFLLILNFSIIEGDKDDDIKIYSSNIENSDNLLMTDYKTSLNNEKEESSTIKDLIKTDNIIYDYISDKNLDDEIKDLNTITELVDNKENIEQSTNIKDSDNIESSDEYKKESDMQLPEDIKDSDNIENINDNKEVTEHSIELSESLDDNKKLSDNIEKKYSIPQIEDIPLPDIYIIAFTNYEFYENPYMIKYDCIVRIANYPNNEIHNITMKLDIVTVRLRFLEIEEMTCIKKIEMAFNIYRFICSKEVRGPVSKVSYIDDTILLNGKIPLEASMSEVTRFFGKNIQNQTNNSFSDPNNELVFFNNCSVNGENNKLKFEGETIGPSIKSEHSTLSFVQNESIKNIICSINDENNRFNMVCQPDFSVNADLSNNNEVYIDDFGKSGMMFFEEGKSIAKLEVDESKKITITPIKSEEKSKIIIFVLLFSFIGLIIIVMIIVILLRRKSNSKQSNQKDNKSPLPSLNDISEDSCKEKVLPKDPNLGLNKNNNQK